MTVIIGYTDGKNYAIGGDSGAFDEGGLYQLTGEPKVWKSGDSLIGGAGSFRIIELARKSGLNDPYALRNHLIESNPGGEWSLLVVTKKALYELCDDFSVVKFKENYAAIGAGNSVATGAIATLAETKVEPDMAVRVALKVTVRHCNMAMAPFTVVKS
jgi:hypothetical protein